jgi:hypothetical protein
MYVLLNVKAASDLKVLTHTSVTSLGGVTSIHFFLHFQNANDGADDKTAMFSRLCKHRLTL